MTVSHAAGPVPTATQQQRSCCHTTHVPKNLPPTRQQVALQQRRQGAVQQLPVLQAAPPKGVARLLGLVGDAQQVGPVNCKAAAAAGGDVGTLDSTAFGIADKPAGNLDLQLCI